MSIEQLFDMTGRVAVVTGAAGNLGGATAEVLADAGADVLMLDINVDELERRANHLAETTGRRVIAQACDVTDLGDVDQVFATVDEEFGRIDTLVNFAGPSVHGAPEDISVADVAATVHGIVVARFAMCQQAGRRMLAAGKGSIINTGSLASTTALGRGHIAYSLAMGAVAQMTRELSTEWASRGVRVNAILPAQVLNEGLSERIAVDPELEQVFLRGLPIGRIGDKNEVKGLALFLASDASSFVTGTLIPLDGGNLAKNSGGSHPGMPLPRSLDQG